MDQNTLAEEATGAENNESQVENQNQNSNGSSERTYTQKEVDDMMAKTKSSAMKKALKPYEDLPPPEELRSLKQEAEEKRQKEQIDRGEFEKTLQELAAKKDEEIKKRDEMIREYKVNTPLLEAASKYKSVSPEQVRTLLSNQVKLSDEGEVVVVDNKGTTKYNDSGNPLSVDELVQGFLSSNPHFVQASPSTSSTKTSHGQGDDDTVDISRLDMSKPEHRRLYADAKAKGKLKTS
jgi:hypothetical protein